MQLEQQIISACKIQIIFTAKLLREREVLLLAYADALKASREQLAEILALDAKKTQKDAQAEVDGAADILGKIIADCRLPDMGGMSRRKERQPVGVVGLITSFNFPMAVAHWTIVPAILAGNSVLWKPSEKTPKVAHACKKLFDEVAGELSDVLHIIEGGRDVGEALVADERIDMISATGSVAMGESIRKTLAQKKNNRVPPILELGGNNAAVIGAAMSESHLEWSLQALLQSFLATTGQRCTNTRRLIVHENWLDKTVTILERLIAEFVAVKNNPENSYGYNMLIDEAAQKIFDHAKTQVIKEGGRILFGGDGEPALAVMPKQTPMMHVETFAPLLYIVPYTGDMKAAMVLVNAPENAGLVNAIYTLSQQEADDFARLNEAGHSLINSPKGTGTPAYGMGFGGNKASGCGEILNSSDPLAAFTRAESFKRIAQNLSIPLSS